MTLAEELLMKGWHLSATGLDICKEGLDKISAPTIIEKALNTDLRDIGESFLSDEIQKGKVDYISGNCILQIQKLKNVASPKYETSNSHNVLLRLLLTDGQAYISCLQWDLWKSVTLDTPPGTKLFIKAGQVQIQNGFLLLKESQYVVLGGQVSSMVEKWELSKQFALDQRRGTGSEEGPPPWIPFGKSINYKVSKAPAGNFRSLEPDAKKEEKEDIVFKQQRNATIAKISRSKEGTKKVFGGGKDLVANENVADSSMNSSVQDKKYFSSHSDTRKRGNTLQKFTPLEKTPFFRTTDYSQEKGHDSENTDFQHRNSGNSHYNNTSDYHTPGEDGHYTERIGNFTTLFYRDPTSDFSHQENRSGKSLYSPNVSSGRSRFQTRGNRREHSLNDFANLSIDPHNIQDRHRYEGPPYSSQEENRSNFNTFFHHNPHSERRTVNRNEEVKYAPNPPPYKYEEDDFPVPESNQERNNFRGVWEFRRGGNRPFIRRNDENYQDRQRDRPPHQSHRPPTRLYRPPRQRRG